MKKRILALLLSLVIIFTMIPVQQVHAESAVPACSNAGGHKWTMWNKNKANCFAQCDYCKIECNASGKETSATGSVAAYAHDYEFTLTNCENKYSPAYGKAKCKTCGNTWQGSLAEYGLSTKHNFVNGKCTYCVQEDPNFKPTCEDLGVAHDWKLVNYTNYYECTKCKAKCYHETYGEWTLSDCLNASYYSRKCTVCGKNDSSKVNDRKDIGHDLDETNKCKICGVQGVPPCEVHEYNTNVFDDKCTVCGIPCKHEAGTFTVYANCISKEYDRIRCIECNYQIHQVANPRTNHSPVDGVCTYCGTEVVICDVHESWDSSTGRCVACGTLCEHENYGVRYKAYTDYICNIGGIVNKICENCGKIVGSFNVKGNVAEIGPEGHAYDMETEGEVIKAATCTEDGIKVYHCVMSVCKDDPEAVKEVVIKKLPHTPVELPAVAPTCTEDGLTAGSKCSVCGEILVSQLSDEKTGHAFNETGKCGTCNYQCEHKNFQPSVQSNKTCTTPYICNNTCKDCPYQWTVTEPMTGHNYTIVDKVVEATCNTDGYTVYKCANAGCLNTENRDVVKASHKNEIIPAVAPTCTEKGSTAGEVCTKCGTYVTVPQPVDALRHAMNDGEITTPATCTEYGVFTYSCTRDGCDYSTFEWITPGHKPGEEVIIQAPTCTADGLRGYACTVCNEAVNQEVIKALGHDYVNHEGKTPTCEEGGWSPYKTCNRCNGTFGRTEFAATDHDYKATVTAPDCVNGGYTTYTCSKCGDSYTGNVTSAQGHAYTVEVTTQPTCTEAGVKTFTCSVCNDSYTESVNAKGHDYKATVTAPTCTAAGYTTYTCACGDSYNGDEVAETGHDYNGVVTIAPTYNEKGEKTYTCKNCGDSYTEEIDALKHNYIAVETVAPTCTEEGYTTYACNECEDTYRADFVPALGHDYEEEVTTEPTCTTEGVKTYTCTCGDSYTEEVAVLAHDYKEAVTAPTCTAAGYTTYTCTKCGDTYTGNEVAATGHDYEEEVTTEPTCTTDGVKTYTCSACDDSYTEEVAALAHDYKEAVTAPTCTAAGYTTYTCTKCGDTYTDNEVAATGHDYEEEVTTEPTCTTEGVKTYTCTCGDSYTEVMVAAGHNIENVVAQTATCAAIGWDAYEHCTKCDYTTYQEIAKDADNHADLKQVEAQAATCTEDGWKAYEYCTACDYTTKEVIKAAHVDLKQVEAQAATCTEDGWKAYEYCAECGYTTKEVIQAAHVDLKQVEAQAATCTEDGWKAYEYCGECGYTTKEVVKAAHVDLKQVEAQAATCTEDGWKAYEFCGECDYTTKEVIPATDHNYVYAVTTQPTETAAGVLTGSCSGCQETVSVALPALSEEDYTYEVVEEPTEESTGIGCYTWKVTKYGEVKIEVELEKLPATIYGDFNDDGELTNSDVIALLWYVLFPDDYSVVGNGDFNGDGAITNADVIDLLWYVLFPTLE